MKLQGNCTVCQANNWSLCFEIYNWGREVFLSCGSCGDRLILGTEGQSDIFFYRKAAKIHDYVYRVFNLEDFNKEKE